MSHNIEGRTSGRLSALPLVHHQFDIYSVEFCDALSLQYHQSLLRVPFVCDGCGASLSLGHVLDWRKRGLVTQRHNKIRDAMGDVLVVGYKEVLKELIVLRLMTQKTFQFW